MQITYIYHSCFLAETADCYYLFDYYKGDLPMLNTYKPIMVFASHAHSDHYNEKVFDLLKEQGMKQVTAILSKDIPASRYPQDTDCIKVTFHETYQLPCDTLLKTLHSTDEGVAFLLQCPEGTVYHAGDLNDWVWAGESEQYNKQMTGSYRHEIDLIKNTAVDVAFLPLDPRQEKDYANGMLYFLKKVKVSTVYPMHYWEKPEIIDQFLAQYPEYKTVVSTK